MNVDRDAFTRQLHEGIVAIVYECMCPSCHMVSLESLSSYPHIIACPCRLTRRCKCKQSPCDYLSENDLLDIWMQAVIMLPSPFFSNLVDVLIRSSYIVNNLRSFLRIANILSFYVLNRSDGLRSWIEYCMRLHTIYYNARGIDFVRAMRVTRYSCMTAVTNDQRNEFEERIRTLHNSYIHPAWEQWEMDTNEYTSLVQWLPHEMLADITQFTNQPASPHSYI